VLNLGKLIVEPSLIVEPGTTTKRSLVVVTPRVVHGNINKEKVVLKVYGVEEPLVAIADVSIEVNLSTICLQLWSL
jgi:hypothetical protein